MNKIVDDYPVIKKYGKNVVLSKDNIKDIYFITFCNTWNENEYIEWFLRKNYSKDEILKWNDEYVNLRLDVIDKLLLEECNYENAKDITFNFSLSVEIYTTNRKTYIRIIETLKRYFNKYGYFSCYPIRSKDIDEYEYPFDCFISIIIYNAPFEKEKMSKASGNFFHYFKHSEYRGLIPSLYYSNYLDLINRSVKELFIPIINHYIEPSKLMKDNNLVYDLADEKDTFKLNLIKNLKNFVKENKINLNFDI